MISKEKLADNLTILRNQIPQKPKIYTSDHPVTIKEALDKYSNRRTIHGVQTCTNSFNNEHWPLPLWFDPMKIKVGFWNKFYYKKHNNTLHKKKFNGFKDFDYLWLPAMNKIFYKTNFDESIVEAFDANIKYIQKRLKSNPLLQSKAPILQDVFRTYNKEYWVACISTLFPVLDYVARKLLNTKNLSIDISKMCKLFEQNGFSLETVDHLMPHITLVNLFQELDEPNFHEKWKELHEKVKDNEYGLIGPALSSFLRFANNYYGYYREDLEENNVINRHAILHGSINEFGNKENAIKLLTFLYLFLELEPVFEILLKE